MDGFYTNLDVQLQEFGSTYEPETLRDRKKTAMADVIVYVHDSSDTNSFSYISNLRVRWLASLLAVSPLIFRAATIQPGSNPHTIRGNEK